MENSQEHQQNDQNQDIQQEMKQTEEIDQNQNQKKKIEKEENIDKKESIDKKEFIDNNEENKQPQNDQINEQIKEQIENLKIKKISYINLIKIEEEKIEKFRTEYENKQGHDLTMIDLPSKTSLISAFIKKIIKKLFMGGLNIITMQKPAIATSNFTQLFLMTYDMMKILNHFNSAAITQDHLQKLQFVISGVFGLLLNGFFKVKGKAPLNALLGETIQLETEDGSKLYFEIISLVPLRVIFEVFGPNNMYKIEGEHYIKNSITKTLSQFKNEHFGKFYIKFKDGSNYEAICPDYVVYNPVGTPYVVLKGKMMVNDLTRNIFSEGIFIDEKEKDFEPNLVKINIFKQLEENRIPIQQGKGYYGRCLIFDEQIYFKQTDDDINHNSQQNLLPSDSLQRKAIQFIKEKNYQEADKILEEEEKQIMYDNKLRNKGKKYRK